MRSMRINLVTPFAEKDAAKALGARWDSAKKTWYIQNVADLAPFRRWIPANGPAPTTELANPPAAAPRRATVASASSSTGGTVTRSVTELPHCGCDVLPWQPCAHHA